MPRFHFHLFNHIGVVRDDVGREMPDLAAARQAAADDIRSLLSEDARAGLIDLRGRIEISDPHGEVLETVKFGDAVEIRPDGGGS